MVLLQWPRQFSGIIIHDGAHQCSRSVQMGEMTSAKIDFSWVAISVEACTSKPLQGSISSMDVCFCKLPQKSIPLQTFSEVHACNLLQRSAHSMRICTCKLRRTSKTSTEVYNFLNGLHLCKPKRPEISAEVWKTQSSIPLQTATEVWKKLHGDHKPRWWPTPL